MPYVTAGERQWMDPLIEGLLRECKYAKAGALNYVVTKILLSTKPERYEDYNRLVGVLECCKLELVRRGLVPYEEARKTEHGDVF